MIITCKMNEGRNTEVIKKLLNYRKETTDSFKDMIPDRTNNEIDGWLDNYFIADELGGQSHYERNIKNDEFLSEMLEQEFSSSLGKPIIVNNLKKVNRNVYKLKSDVEHFLKLYIFCYDNHIINILLNSDYFKDNIDIFKRLFFDCNYFFIENIVLKRDDEKRFFNIKYDVDPLLFYFYAKDKQKTKKMLKKMTKESEKAGFNVIDTANFTRLSLNLVQKMEELFYSEQKNHSMDIFNEYRQQLIKFALDFGIKNNLFKEKYLNSPHSEYIGSLCEQINEHGKEIDDIQNKIQKNQGGS